MNNRSSLTVLLVAATAVCCTPAYAKLKAQPGAPAASAAEPPPAVAPVEINSASIDELKTLPGVDDALARRIVANRPYYTKTWLVTKKVVPEATYQALHRRIVAVPKGTPAPARTPRSAASAPTPK